MLLCNGITQNNAHLNELSCLEKGDKTALSTKVQPRQMFFIPPSFQDDPVSIFYVKVSSTILTWFEDLLHVTPPAASAAASRAFTYNSVME
jgi:hypothetical protein